MNPNVDLSRFSRTPGEDTGGLVSPPRRLAARYGVPLVLLAGFGVLGAYSLRDSISPPRAVRVIQPALVNGLAAAEASSPAFQAPGWIEPDPFPVTVSALTMGIVRKVHVLEGQHADAGDLIAELVDDDARIAVDMAAAAVARKKAERDGARENWENPIALVEAVKAAQAESRRLETQLEDSRRAFDLARQQASIDTDLSRGGALGQFPAIQTKSALRAAEIAIRETTSRIAASSATLEAALGRARLRTEDRQRLAVAEAELRDAEARLADARLKLAWTRVTAPTSGTVMRLYVGPGSMLSTQMDKGMRVAAMYDPSRIQARAEVPLADAAKVRSDLPAEIRIESLPDRAFRGVLTRIVHEADIQRNTLPVKVRILDPDPALKPEMVVRLTFVETGPTAKNAATAGPAIFLPSDLAAGDGAGTLWLAAPDGRAVPRGVKWGARTREGLREVAAGIGPTDKVIISGTGDLRPGTRVRVEEGQ